MANEIQISASTGLVAVTVTLYESGVIVGAPFLAAEIGATGEYITSMPALTPAGHYVVVITVAGQKIAAGEMFWDGQYEYIEGITTIQGLVPGRPSTTTPTNWTAGSINIDITGDAITNTVMTRN